MAASLDVVATVLGLAAAAGYSREASACLSLCAELASPASCSAWLLWQTAVDCGGAGGRTRLMAAAFRGSDEARLAALLAAGADVSRRDARGACAVHWAVRGGSAPALATLLAWRGSGGGAAGAKLRSRAAARVAAAVNARDDRDRTPLHEAAASGRADLARALLAAGAVPGAGDKLGSTPVMAAVRAGAVDVLQALVAAGGKQAFAARDLTGWTAATIAAFSNQTRALDVLAAAGARVTADASADGRSAMHHAATKGHVEAVRWLLAHGASVDARDGAGATPLADAAFGGHAAVVDLLLRAGADARARDDFGRTPFSIAASLSKAHAPVLALLRAAGATEG